MHNASALLIQDLAHDYGQGAVFTNLCLEIYPGELVAVLGASGTGKSTLLRSVAGFVTPDKGSIALAGKVVAEDGREFQSAEQRRVGMVFQDYALFEHMSVRENVAFGIPKHPTRRQRVDALLELVGLTDFADRRPASLSGGQQQRIALIRALAPRPALLVLDEPFANLDGPLLREVSAELRRILAVEGVSALLVTHERGEALGLADRIAVLDTPSAEGPARLVQTARPEEVYNQPTTAGVATLTGPASFIEGEAQGHIVRTALGNIPLYAERDGPCRVVIRPEQIQLEQGKHKATVLHRRFEGASYELELETAAGRLIAHTHNREAPQLGSTIHLRVIGPCAAID
jgi:iron(III) transport system ATP-binding protein